MRLTFSGLGRALLCAGSNVLPQVRDLEMEGWSEEGTVLHRFLFNIPKMGAAAALRAVPEEHRDACAAINLEKLPTLNSAGWAHEVSYAYAVELDQGFELARGQDRDTVYSTLLPALQAKLGTSITIIPGTVDVVAISGDGKMAIVVDYKRGFSDKGPLSEHWQLRGYALVVARACNVDEVRIVRIRLLNGEPRVEYLDLDVAKLDQTALQVERACEAQARYQRSPHNFAFLTRDLVRGEHCRFCGARPRCPAFVDLALRAAPVQVVRGGAPAAQEARARAREDLQLPPLTTATAPQYLLAAEHLEQIADWLRAGVDKLSKEEPISLASGELYGPHEWVREPIDVEAAAPILQELLGADRAAQVVLPRITRDSIYAVLQDMKKENSSVKLGEKKREILKALRDGGALKRKVTYPIGPYTPKKRALPAGEDDAAEP